MKTIEIRNPFNNTLIEKVTLQSETEVQAALDLAYNAYLDQKNWLPKYEIIKILEKTMEIMSSRIEELTIIAANEGGKPYIDSKVEVARAINGIKVAIEHMGSFEGKEVAMGHTPSSANRMAYTMKEPIGVVLSISAFNHPLNLAIHQVVPAIAVGSPVIIRPSASTPLSTINFINILYEAGLPKQFAQVVVCDRVAAENMVKSPKISFLSFIGSGAVGWHLNSVVAPGTRVALEHGGVAPVIVEKDADIEELIPALLKGGFYHAGQVCVSVQRVFVHQSIIGEVAQQMVDGAKKLIVGDQLDPKTEVGPIISHKENERIALWVDEAIQEGAELLCGGEKLSDSCYKPTILLNPSQNSKVSKEEVFGPVVCLYSYDDIEDAFTLANSLEVSFQAAVFTKNIDTALAAVKRLNATTVMVNDHTAFRVDWMPFGGAKASGLGMGGIPHSMQEMSKEKLMVIKSASI